MSVVLTVAEMSLPMRRSKVSTLRIEIDLSSKDVTHNGKISVSALSNTLEVFPYDNNLDAVTSGAVISDSGDKIGTFTVEE